MQVVREAGDVDFVGGRWPRQTFGEGFEVSGCGSIASDGGERIAVRARGGRETDAADPKRRLAKNREPLELLR